MPEHQIYGTFDQYSPSSRQAVKKYREYLVHTFGQGNPQNPQSLKWNGGADVCNTGKTGDDVLESPAGDWTVQEIMITCPHGFGYPTKGTILDWGDHKTLPLGVSAQEYLRARLKPEEDVTHRSSDDAAKEWHRHEIMVEFPGSFVTVGGPAVQAVQGAHGAHPLALPSPVPTSVPTATDPTMLQVGQASNKENLVSTFTTYTKALIAYMLLGEHFIDLMKRPALEEEATAVALFSTAQQDLNQALKKTIRSLEHFTRLASKTNYYAAVVKGPSFPLAQLQTMIISGKGLQRPVPGVSASWTDSTKYTQHFNDLTHIVQQAAETHKVGDGNSNNADANAAYYALMLSVNDLRRYILNIVQATHFHRERRDIKRELSLKHKFNAEAINSIPLLEAHQQNSPAGAHSVQASDVDKLTPEGIRVKEAMESNTESDSALLKAMLAANDNDHAAVFNALGIHDSVNVKKLTEEWESTGADPEFRERLHGILLDISENEE